MKRRAFAQAACLSTLTMPLSLSLVACGGGSDGPADTALSASAPPAAPVAVATERPQVKTSTKAVPSYPDERVFVGPSAVLYSLNKRSKALTYPQGTVSLAAGQLDAIKSNPVDLDFDASGNAYVLDKSLGEVRVYNALWQLQRRFGQRGSGDAALSNPSAVAVHGERLFIADAANHRVQVFSLAGTPLSRFDGTGAQGSSFNYPIDVKVAADGRVYVLHAESTVTVHDAAGRITGQLDLSKDTSGARQAVRAIALSPAGQLYFSDVTQGRVYALDAGGLPQVKLLPQSASGKPVAARYLAVGPDGQLHVSGLLPLAT